MENKKNYPIGYVALATGLSPHVIRVWEKRYGAVMPERTEKHRRLYSESDIGRLKLLNQARLRGQRIGTAATLDEVTLQRIGHAEGLMAAPAKPALGVSKQETTDASSLLNECVEAVRRLEAEALLDGLRRARAHLPRPHVLTGVITPLMQRIGDGWADGSFRIMHEHFASNVVRGFLWEIIRSAWPQPHASTMVVTTPEGQLCEIGAMMTAVTAADCGWNALYLGPSLPAEDIAAAALHERAVAVALSLACSVREGFLESELSLLRQALGDAVPIFVGGRAVHAHHRAVRSTGAHCFESLLDFREFIARPVSD
jgi:MerR family transcriptional regulator, light-induced transcriptional regulator